MKGRAGQGRPGEGRAGQARGGEGRAHQDREWTRILTSSGIFRDLHKLCIF